MQLRDVVTAHPVPPPSAPPQKCFSCGSASGVAGLVAVLAALLCCLMQWFSRGAMRDLRGGNGKFKQLGADEGAKAPPAPATAAKLKKPTAATGEGRRQVRGAGGRKPPPRDDDDDDDDDAADDGRRRPQLLGAGALRRRQGRRQEPAVAEHDDHDAAVLEIEAADDDDEEEARDRRRAEPRARRALIAAQYSRGFRPTCEPSELAIF